MYVEPRFRTIPSHHVRFGSFGTLVGWGTHQLLVQAERAKPKRTLRQFATNATCTECVTNSISDGSVFAGPAPFRWKKRVFAILKKKPLGNNISATHDNNSRFYLTNRRSKKDLREKGGGEVTQKKGATNRCRRATGVQTRDSENSAHAHTHTQPIWRTTSHSAVGLGSEENYKLK